MAKVNYSKINVKAAAITGAVVAFLCGLFAVGLSFSGIYNYGFGMISSYMREYAISAWFLIAFLYFVLVIIIGAITGILVAAVYNWVLTLNR